MDYFIFLFYLFALLTSVSMVAAWWAWDSHYRGPRWRSALLFLFVVTLPTLLIAAPSVVIGYAFWADGLEPEWLLPTGVIWTLLYLGAAYVVGGNYKFTRVSHAAYAEKHPPKWPAKKAWVASACFLLCSLLTFGVLQSRAMDRLEVIERQAIEHLQGVYPKPVADAENAYLVFEQASKLLEKDRFDSSLYGDLLAGKTMPRDPLVERALKKHQEALALIRKGAAMKQWSVHVETGMDNFIYHVRWHASLSLLGADALYQMHLGNIKGVSANLHTLSLLASTLQTRPDLVGQALASRAIRLIMEISERLMGHGHDIADMSAIIPAASSKHVNERFRDVIRMETALMDLDLRVGIESGGLFEMLYAIGGLNYDYDYTHALPDHIQGSLKGSVPGVYKALSSLGQMLDNKQFDVIGRAPTMLMDGRIRPEWFLRIVEADARLAVLQLALAAESYHHDHGNYPKAAADLVPAYLDAEPLDPFDGQPLRFKPSDNGLLIYSIGMNLKDDGGTLSEFGMSGDLPFYLGKAYLTNRVSLESLVRMDDLQGVQ